MISTSRRFLTFVFACVQLAMPAFASIADGMRTESRETVAHVEDGATSRCPPVHSAECAVCRYLTGAATGAVALHGLGPSVRTHVGVAAVERPAGPLSHVRERSRAPPALLS